MGQGALRGGEAAEPAVPLYCFTKIGVLMDTPMVPGLLPAPVTGAESLLKSVSAALRLGLHSVDNFSVSPMKKAVDSKYIFKAIFWRAGYCLRAARRARCMEKVATRHER